MAAIKLTAFWPYDADTNRVRADSGLPHVSLLRAQVGDLHSQTGRQGLHVTCQPGEGRGSGCKGLTMDKPTWCRIQRFHTFFLFGDAQEVTTAYLKQQKKIKNGGKKRSLCSLKRNIGSLWSQGSGPDSGTNGATLHGTNNRQHFWEKREGVLSACLYPEYVKWACLSRLMELFHMLSFRNLFFQ